MQRFWGAPHLTSHHIYGLSPRFVQDVKGIPPKFPLLIFRRLKNNFDFNNLV